MLSELENFAEIIRVEKNKKKLFVNLDSFLII